MLLSVKKVNNEKVMNFAPKQEREYPIKGKDIVPYKYPNICVVGRHGSGKSTLAMNLIAKLSGNHTYTAIFSPTIEHDPSCITFLKAMFTKDQYEINDSLYIPVQGPKGGIQKIDGLSCVLADFFEDDDPYVEFNQLCPRLVIMIDDLPIELKSKNLSRLFKTIRHHLGVCICCFHDVKDIARTARQEIDVLFCFGGVTKDRFVSLLEEWGTLCGPRDKPYPAELVYEIYTQALKKPYDFITIYRDGQIRLGLDKELSLADVELKSSQ